MNKLPAGLNNALVGRAQNMLMTSSNTFQKWGLHQQLVAVNCFMFGCWAFGSGINAQWMRKNLSMTPGSSPLTMATTHFVHYDPVLFALNTAVLWKCGLTFGAKFSMPLVLGIGLTSGLFAAWDMRNTHSKSYASGLGLSAGLLTYGGVAGFVPYALGMIPLGLLYSVYKEDKAVMGGIIGGYAIFMTGVL